MVVPNVGHEGLEKKLYAYLSGAKRYLEKEVLDHHIYDDLFLTLSLKYSIICV